MQLKHGVSVKGIAPQFALMACVIDDVYHKHECEMIVTAGVDGKHMDGSLHYKGLAMDVRTHNVPRAELPILLAEVRGFLGDEFDVILEGEGTDNEHLHAEYDPK
jgi:hypothetical protein